MNQEPDFSYDTGHLATPQREEPARDAANQGIAVIGLAGFFPGSASVEDFCSRLDRQESLFINPPEDHFPADAVRHRLGAFLSGISQFDPEVFKITPLEAEYLDPRQRLLLMSVWHAMEDACYLPGVLSESRTDVYIASEGAPYATFMHAAEITPYSPTGASSSSLPNRISHAFRLRGKSIFVDTACSGSLVAVHQAMQALRRNETDYAVVGAVNLLLGDEVSLSFLGQESLGIVVDSDTCYPFQNAAKGFLPAEGVVTVVLKRLSDAKRDNDNIHAVLLGSCVNHSGGRGSLTMPSAEAQSEVIVGAYRDAGIAPGSVTYLEAHGASTVLADVEEIQAFKIADRKLLDLLHCEISQPCKISTIKPNIGHANCVSGLMSLVRAVYSLKQAKKLGVKNFTALSDRISLDGTRFYINATSETWEPLTDSSGLPIPRRAAINNFGAGGVNVHLLLEEFVRPQSTNVESAPSTTAPYYLALSAYYTAQLQLQVSALVSHLKEAEAAIPPEDLEALFITSRTAFPCRLLFRYKNLNELIEKLDRYRTSDGMKGYHLKRDVRDKNEAMELFYKYQQLSAFCSTLRTSEDKGILFDLWSLGFEEPIRDYYRGNRYRKQSLPRYPFSLKSFWVKPRDSNTPVLRENNSVSRIHPLLHFDVSDSSEQRYRSVFAGEEFFLKEHVVRGQRVLPGVAYLEMARAAITHSTRTQQKIRLQNVVWARPIIVDKEPKTIHTRLKSRPDGRIDFEICSGLTSEASGSTVHCQGSASLFTESIPVLNIEEHERECSDFSISAQECYRAFRNAGIDHGAAFQGVQAIQGKPGHVLAKILLPMSLMASGDSYVLHPSIMDSALQALLGLVADPTKPTLPFALQELEVFAACPAEAWASVRNSASFDATSKVHRVDIDLCDSAGNVCVRLRGFSTRSVETKSTQPAPAPPKVAPVARVVSGTAGLKLSEKIESLLETAVSVFLRISGRKLDRDAEFNSLGFDSVSLIAFTNELNRTHRLELDPTLFFEHTTIRQFAAYLATAQGKHFAEAPASAAEDTSQRHTPSPEFVRDFARVAPAEDSRAKRSPNEPIAIVGVSGRFPMADDVHEFWNNLEMGRDCITEIPAARWDWKEIYGDPKTELNKTRVKWGGFISGVDEFDPLFFGISPKEAELMDPQQRLLMMFVWNAIEDAGYSAQRLSGANAGIFVGTGAGGYNSIIAKANVPIEAYTSTGMVPSVGPNRMSYYLNFHGPSEPIETACSSSLVAIHRAVESIRSGSCDMAVAGGISTIVTPDLHISFSKAGMLCEDGRCKTFSDRANGYVRGEGVGMLFLKRLRDAEEAGDHIYGVILGSAENHGGRTNSLTAPNPKAQADVVSTAQRKAGVDPRSITYIEAHGTGTGLGDPIEINGLKMAFNVSSPEPFCGVGSVKTNIGHLEVAAGVSGVIKVLLQMKHKRLAPSLHCETLNPYIQLQNSPFYIVKDTTEWRALPDKTGKKLPRRAGVSSFGFGGVNAHVVLEEYLSERSEPPQEGALDKGREAAILLSARSAQALKERVRQLYVHLQENPAREGEFRLDDIAFTLQVGRDAMEERLALIVRSVEELKEKLARILAGDEDVEDSFRGKLEKHDGILSIFNDNDELKSAVDLWLEAGKARELSRLWVKGLTVEWEKFRRERQPQRVSLPGYPFAKQRCWVTNQASAQPAVPQAGRVIHPLLHSNVSTLGEQRYHSEFSGNEFFLADHVLKGVRLLPAVAYLEMARAAIHHATRDLPGWRQIRLQNVAWTSPFIFDEQTRSLDVILLPEAEDVVSFKIFSGPDSGRKLHFQGAALRGEADASAIDLAKLRSECNLGKMSSEESYERSERLGFQYGATFRTLGDVYKGSDRGLGTINLTPEISKSLDQYVLHPSVMDAALQASMALVLDLNRGSSDLVTNPALPYFADEIEVVGSCAGSVWTLIRHSEARNSEHRNIKTCDIDICDEIGNPSVRIKGLSFIVVAEDASLTHPTAAPAQTGAVVPEQAEEDEIAVLEGIQRTLISTVSSISKLDPAAVELDRDLKEYGFDSISLINFSDTLNRLHNLNLTPAILFEHLTIRSLSAELLKKYPLAFGNSSLQEKPARVLDTVGPSTVAVQEQPRARFLSSTADRSAEPIAIVGMSGRFPLADDIEEFWSNLSHGRDCVGEIPPERWDWKDYFGDPRKERNKTNVKWGGFISGLEKFDPSFFGISPQEAELMDPTQRLLMQYVWKAIEDAGYSASSLSGSRTAIIVGLGASGYHSLASAGDMAIESYTSTGMAPSFGPNRMSYFLNFRGPSEPIETACSSSLIALHRARVLIQNDICDMAVVGGINTMVTPLLHISFSKAGMLSDDGRCRPFSAAANGYVRGEGVGMLFLKRLKDAERSGDHIYGIIAGSAENHGGHATWMTAPNPQAQAEVIRAAYSTAGVDPRTVTYIEAHGTGTAIGDSVEINALKSVFSVDGALCAIGSVKSNVGHLELAAGVAGIIKVLLQLRHKRLAKTLHCETVNPYIDLKESPFYLLQEASDWPSIQDPSGRSLPRRAGISAFGFGGVNAHVLIEEYVKNTPVVQNESSADETFAILLSAKTPDRLQQMVKNLLGFLVQSPALNLRIEDLAYTLQVGRDAMDERIGIIVQSIDDLRRKLEMLSRGSSEVAGVHRGTVKRRGAQKAAQTLIEKKSYSEILELWVRGTAVDWSQLYQGVQRRRLSLPTYPFAEEKYWIDTYGRKSSGATTPGNEGHSDDRAETVFYRPRIVTSNVRTTGHPLPMARRIFLCGTGWAVETPDIQCLRIQSEHEDIAGQYEDYAIGLFSHIQQILSEDAGRDSFVQVIVPIADDPLCDEQHVLIGLQAILAAAERENPRFHGQLIAMNPRVDDAAFLERIQSDRGNPDESFVRYANERQVRIWERVLCPESVRPWKDHGVYLITGGAGALGLLFAREIAVSVASPTIILVGRSVLNDHISANIAELGKLGARVRYLPLDVGNRSDVAAVVVSIEREFGGLHGVIHAAGVVRDKTITRKTKHEFTEVLAPKVRGLVNLDLATQSAPLDFFLLFSSAASIFGNIGQADYAAANAFLDGYARYRNRRVHAGQRRGRTLSINWSLWKDGGMQAPPEFQKIMEEQVGLLPIPNDKGIQAVSRAFATNEDQILVLHALPNTLDARLPALFRHSEVVAAPAAGSASSRPLTRDHETLQEHVRNVLRDRLSEALAIEDKGIIGCDDSFGDCGLDSMAGVQFIQHINRDLKLELNVTVLFDHTTINQLTRHIAADYDVNLSAVPESSTERTATAGTVDDPADGIEEQKYQPASDRTYRSEPSVNKEPIAIIGMSGRFAKSASLDELWDSLATGSSLVDEVTRWDLSAHYAADPAHHDGGCRHGGLLNDIDRFDPMFFNISAIEATYMDPQQRLFLEEAWRALEDAGYAGQSTDGLACGVYVGCSNGDYYHLAGDALPAQGFWGNAASIIPARISYYMNLHGPAIAIDTACSSSLVAIHNACQGLWSGETEMALAGGVYVQATPAVYLLATRAGMLSPTGRCHTFDQAADGFVPGEGVGVVVLKRLSQALDDGDHIHGVILGSGINQDGKTNGITAPSSKSQERLERQVYESFHINPETIQMVEAHGTGTKLGDPIEFEALTRAFRKDTVKNQYCALGSIKTNIGHAATAAGVAGLIRILLSFKHKQIPPSLNFASANENISLAESPFYINTHLKDWQVAPGAKRRAAVSSFSFNGTNAHMVLEEAPELKPRHPERPAYLIVLSARTTQQLRQQADQLRDCCGGCSDIDCGNISYTLLVGRKHLNQRLAVIVRDVAELVNALSQWSATGKSSKVQLSDAAQKEHHEPALLRRYGNQCIGKAAVATAAAELLENLAVISELYLQGYELDYQKLFREGGYRRIALPTYPFSRDTYWIPSPASSSESTIIHRQEAIAAPRLNVSSSSSKGGQPNDETVGGAVTLMPIWDTVVVDKQESSLSSRAANIVIIGADARHAEIRSQLPGASFLELAHADSVETIEGLLKQCGAINDLVWIAPPAAEVSIFDEAILEQERQVVLTGFRLIKALLALGYGARTLSWTVISHKCQPALTGEDLRPIHSSLHGLIGSMAQEYSNWRIRLVDLADPECPLEDILQLPTDPRGAAWAWRNHRWRRRRLVPCHGMDEKQFSYRQGGVYVVIGGAGGIGEVWSEFMLRHHQARLIWIGRRAQDAEISRKLKRLSAFAEPPTYISADAANAADMAMVYHEIKRRYPFVHGVVHSAVGVFDQSLAEMSEQRFEQGLAAKVNVSVRIAQTFREEPLDFMVFFSSLDSFTTPHGKASYTAGCAFMDAYAYQLSREAPFAVKVMNWGYWGNIGAGSAVPETTKNRLARSGVGSIEPDDGVRALSSLLAGPFQQLAFVKTTKPIFLEGTVSSDTVSPAQFCAPDILDDVVRRVAERNAQVPAPRRTAEENKHTQSTEDLLARLLLCQLESTGWCSGNASERLRLSDIQARSGAYGEWLHATITDLAERKYIDWNGQSFSILNSQLPHRDNLWIEWDKEKRFWSDNPSTKALVELIEKTLQALPEILTGRESATNVIFPNSSMKLVEGIYRGNRIADYFNDLLCSAVIAYVEQHIRKDPAAAIRIFEIGAGTGGVSAGIFEKLQPFKSHIREYCYTDVSKAFLIHGQREYLPKNPYLTFRLYDVEHPEKSTDSENGRYDLVIASNVLHATKFIGQSLRNAKALLQENGLILINEINSKTLFSHLTFGLLEGWWLRKDPEIRIPGCPALTPQSWQSVLEQEGFDSIFFPGAGAHDLGQQIIIARSNGIVRSNAINSDFKTAAAHESVVDNQTVTNDRLLKIVSRVTMVDPQNLQVELTWAELGLDSILSMQVIQEIESEFGLRIFPNELMEHDTIAKLHRFLAAEIENRQSERQPRSTEPAEAPAVRRTGTAVQNPIVFVLSTPRAGSTLLRVMLAGHHQLFSPPELHLLPFTDMGQRAAVLKANHKQFIEEGLIKTLCELQGISVDEAKAITTEWTLAHTPIRKVYEELQDLCPTKLLVDKSPSYGSDLTILENAEKLGVPPIYIHLVRHPLAVMESFVRNRFDRLLSVKEDPWPFAAQLWNSYNANIDKFLSRIPPARWMRIRYEDLVAQPLATMKELCGRLNLHFDARVLDPYEGDRMTGGLYKVSIPLSDPNFNNHDKLESDLGSAWVQHLDKASILSEETLLLAESYGYRFVENQRRKLLPAQQAFLDRFGGSPVWLIVQAVTLTLDGGLDIQRFRMCLQHLVAKHAALRNSFKNEDSSWFQEEGDTYSVPVLCVDGKGRDPHELKELLSALRDDVYRCVDVRTRVNLACGIVDLGNAEYQLILAAHHLVGDGVSMLKLQRDLMESYLSREMVSPIPVPDERMYDYIGEMERRLTPAVLEEHERLWRAHMNSQKYRLPSDVTPANGIADDVSSESEYRLRLPMSTVGAASGRSRREFFFNLSGALYQCLSRWTGLPEIIVAHRLHRRSIGSARDFTDVVGWFAGDVPIKVTVKPDHIHETVAAFRKEFAAIPMGGLSYEVLANSEKIPHSHEVCPVRLNYYPANLTKDVEMDFQKFEPATHARLYTLDLIVSASNEGCVFLVRYSRNQFTEAAIRQFLNRWIEAIQGNPGIHRLVERLSNEPALAVSEVPPA